jgi:hypothetical protein
MSANSPANPAREFAKDRSRGFREETGETVIEQFV